MTELLSQKVITLAVTSEQRIKMDALKVKIESEGLVCSAVGILRYLRARKWNTESAFKQFKSNEDWRTSKKVEKIYDTFDVQEFTTVRDVFSMWTGRTDRNGSPLYLFRLSALTPEYLSAYSADPERFEARMIALFEHMLMFTIPFSSSVPHTNDSAITSIVTIVDISGVSLATFWALRTHLARASELATAAYPETLGRIYCVGAPYYFSVVFGWLSKWFDAQTVDKIFILPSNEVLPTLSKFIEPENIPIAYGGTLEFEFGKSRPNLDQASKDTLRLDELPTGPIRWDKGVFTLKGTGRTEEEIERFTPSERPVVLEIVEIISVAEGSTALEEK